MVMLSALARSRIWEAQIQPQAGAACGKPPCWPLAGARGGGLHHHSGAGGCAICLRPEEVIPLVSGMSRAALLAFGCRVSCPVSLWREQSSQWMELSWGVCFISLWRVVWKRG